MPIFRQSPKLDHGRDQQGFSLVELMVAITISLLLLAGVLQIFLGSRQTYTMQDGMARMQENARYILDRLTQDIGAAGYLGCMDSEEVDGDNQQLIANTLTQQAAGSVYDFSASIFGQEAAGIGGTDILTIRHASGSGIGLTARMVNTTDPIALNTADAAYADLVQYDIVALADCEHVSIFMVTNDPTTSAGAIQHLTGVVAASGPNTGQSNSSNDLQHIYGADTSSLPSTFVVSSTVYQVAASASGNGNSLYANGVAEANELIEGVNDFQVLYGVNDDNDLGADRYVDANNVTTGGTDWNDVVAVRLSLTLSTVETVKAGNTISKTFTTTVRLRNRGENIP